MSSFPSAMISDKERTFIETTLFFLNSKDEAMSLLHCPDSSKELETDFIEPHIEKYCSNVYIVSSYSDSRSVKNELVDSRTTTYM